MKTAKQITRQAETEIIIRVLLVIIVAVMVTTLGLSLSTRTQDILAGTIGIVVFLCHSHAKAEKSNGQWKRLTAKRKVTAFSMPQRTRVRFVV